MIRTGGKISKIGAAALVLALAPAPLLAQSAPDFSLPGARPSTNPRAQGPVDDDHPVIRATPRATPTPAPTPTVVTPAPSPSQPSTAATGPAAAAPRPTGQAPRPGASTAPRQTTAAAPAPQAAGSAVAPTLTPAPGIDQGAVLPSDAAAALPNVQATDSLALPTTLDGAIASTPGWYWPWLAGAAAALAGLFGFLLWRRRKPAPRQLAFEHPVVPQPEAESPALAEEVPTPALAKPLPEPQLTATVPGLSVALEARRMNASLVATTLNYVVRLTNTTDQPLTALAVEGDMIAAHASLPPDQQIASDTQRLELRHALVSLAPGESAEFTGDFRLPLATLVPIRAGNAAYFIPLARLRVEASTPAGDPLIKAQTWVVGELPEQPGTALRPFRLDLGPRTYSRVGQRAVN